MLNKKKINNKQTKFNNKTKNKKKERKKTPKKQSTNASGLKRQIFSLGI